MSADNWPKCPKCSEDARAKFEKAMVAANKLYGKVPAEKYQAALLAAQQTPIEANETLREDYDIGIQDNEFSVSYHCQCTTCGFKWAFKHGEKVCK